MTRGPGAGGAPFRGPPPKRPAPQGPAADAPAQAFDALYTAYASSLVQQASLLTGSRPFARRAVEKAFHQAWQHWPEVAEDSDPGGWVRATVYDYALSPWHRWRWRRRLPSLSKSPSRGSRGRSGPEPATGSGPALLGALLRLPPSQRRALLLHDGLGIGITETAAEMEASTMATLGRVVRARAAVTGHMPALHDVPPAEREEALRRMLAERAAARPLHSARPAHAVRSESERHARLWTLGVLGLTALLVGLVAFTAVTGRT